MTQQVKTMAAPECKVEDVHVGVHALEKPSFTISLWQPVARAENETEELGQRVQKIENLRNEQKEQRLAEVSKNADDGESHSHEVAKGVADKNGGGEPVVVQQRTGDGEQRKHEHEWEHVVECNVVDGYVLNLNQLVHNNKHADDQALARL